MLEHKPNDTQLTNFSNKTMRLRKLVSLHRYMVAFQSGHQWNQLWFRSSIWIQPSAHHVFLPTGQINNRLLDLFFIVGFCFHTHNIPLILHSRWSQCSLENDQNSREFSSWRCHETLRGKLTRALALFVIKCNCWRHAYISTKNLEQTGK